jgi:hypothetical protein
MPKIFRNYYNYNKCISNDNNEITDVTIADKHFKLHKPISYDSIALSLDYIIKNKRFIQFVIDDVTIVCQFDYKLVNKSGNPLILQCIFKIDDLCDDAYDFNEYVTLNLTYIEHTEYGCDRDKIIYIAYILDLIYFINQKSNKYIISGRTLMTKNTYNSIISIINHMNGNDESNICWICRDNCLKNETLACCSHHIHTKCALKIKSMRDKKKKRSEYKCGVCFSKILYLSDSDNNMEKHFQNEIEEQHDTDSDNDE